MVTPIIASALGSKLRSLTPVANSRWRPSTLVYDVLIIWQSHIDHRPSAIRQPEFWDESPTRCEEDLRRGCKPLIPDFAVGIKIGVSAGYKPSTPKSMGLCPLSTMAFQWMESRPETKRQRIPSSEQDLETVHFYAFAVPGLYPVLYVTSNSGIRVHIKRSPVLLSCNRENVIRAELKICR